MFHDDVVVRDVECVLFCLRHFSIGNRPDNTRPRLTRNSKNLGSTHNYYTLQIAKIAHK